MTVWDSLVGQSAVADWLTDAAADASLDPAGPAMTHAWLVTGPPGSGRSTAATAFAAALMCTGSPDSAGGAVATRNGCGECDQCRAVLNGAHPDVEIIRPQGVTYKTADARALVTRASIAPSRGRWHVIVIEDADRLTETANNVLLKAIEEPPPRAVWLLCTPSVEDVLPTIRSRCRHVMLRTPSPDEVADYLIESKGIDQATARFAAHAAQGHVGRAKALARDESARSRRRDILSIPARLLDLRTCMEAADNMVETAKTDARSITDPIDAQEMADLRLAWGQGAEGKGVKSGARGIKGAEKELEDRQKSRRIRTERDQLDRALVDLLGFYRDVLAIQLGAVGGGQIGLINEEMTGQVQELAASSNPIATMWRVDAVERARLALIANVTPRLAMESLTIDLRRPELRRASKV